MSATPARHDAVGDDARIGLSELQNRMLDFERGWTGRPTAKQAAIRSEFGLSAPRYYQLLHALLESPVALAQDPVLVRRLQRLRDARTSAREGRTFLRSGSRTDATTD